MANRADLQASSCLTMREYFMAHAPPMPVVIAEAVARYVNREFPDTPNWNEEVLRAVAKQEQRWRQVYADSMMSALE